MATASPISLIRTIPIPPSAVVEDPSNLITHLAPAASTVETSGKSPRTSSITSQLSSPGNHASKSTIACPFIAVGAIGVRTYMIYC